MINNIRNKKIQATVMCAYPVVIYKVYSIQLKMFTANIYLVKPRLYLEGNAWLA